MTQEPDLTKKQKREAARQARIEREQAEAAAAARKRRLGILGGVLAFAAVIVVVVVAVSSGGSDSTTKKKPGEVAAGQTEVRQMLAGIPQSGQTLGDPKAKVTLVEFADPQCPFCREYALNVLPHIVQDYVRTGKVKLQFQPLHFIGPDSERGARTAVALGQQDRLWNFMDLFYYNQGRENTGYADDAFLRKLGSAIPGADMDTAFAARSSAKVAGALGVANSMAQRYGINSTPSFLVGSGTKLKRAAAQGATLDELTKAIDAELGA